RRAPHHHHLERARPSQRPLRRRHHVHRRRHGRGGPGRARLDANFCRLSAVPDVRPRFWLNQWANRLKTPPIRAILLVIGVTFGSAPPQPVRPVSAASVDEEAPPPQVEEAPPPPTAPTVRLVAPRPPHSRFVGNVRATAPSDDF